MLAEVKKTPQLSDGLSDLVGMMRGARTVTAFEHPILDWLASNQIKRPTLIYDLDLMANRMQRLNEVARTLFVEPLAAVKSCPDRIYLNTCESFLSGFDVSNIAEYDCLSNDLRGKLVSVTSPNLQIDFDLFVAKGNAAVIVLDSLNQVEYYLRQQPHVPYMLRVQGSDLVRSNEQGSYAGSRFGFTMPEVRRLLDRQDVKAHPPSGFHVHHGSERNSVETYRSIIVGLRVLAHDCAMEPGVINLGGGWHRLNEEDICNVLTEARRAFPRPWSILMEPGQWYAENAGFAVGTIVNCASTDGALRYVLDLSCECHLKWSDVNLLYPMTDRSREFIEVQFYGASCYEADRIGKYMLPYNTDFVRQSGFLLGANVIFTNVSLYSLAWNTSFNGIPRANIIWWRDGRCLEPVESATISACNG